MDLETDNNLLKYLWNKIDNKHDLIDLDVQYNKYVHDTVINTEEDVDSAISKIVEWFYDDEGAYCNKLIQKLQLSESLQEYIQGQLQSVPEVVELIIDLKNIDKANLIVQEIDNGDTDEWTKVKDTPELKLFYKQEEGQKLYTFYCEKLINAPLFNLASVMREMQQYKTWIPLLRKTEIPVELTPFRFMSEIVVFVPFPYKYRSAYLNICSMPSEEDDAILICIKSNKTKSGEKWLGGNTITKD